MAAAYCSISSLLYLAEMLIMFCTSCEPLVRVPVLSKMMVVSFLAFSKAVRFLINNPCVADAVVEMATTKGMATPKACGQDVTMTVTILSSAKAKSLFAYHTMNVATPITMEIMVSHLATLSARFCVWDFAFCAD